MTVTEEMLSTYPKDLGGVDQKKLVDCIDACLACAQACTACADACLSEDMVADLIKCIRANQDCADLCITTARILSRRTGHDASVTRAALEACRAACLSCANECEQHTMHEHCTICAEACRRCEQACVALLESL
ncbi:four-helix bundle copper-binding protein [Microbacterium sp. 4-7]|uniref:four-helix bundle copper-binding protein n=1 Tax=Microbacterium sp. 4-7 TaxID=1885327 RepID=UPI001650C1CF|nr:four-helix bundle copper-binding protein [Microbacterium sp. 4-7]MBC6496389.1 four-helix bundle copper-binding protein [Microbacterium sp. 4-7]